MSINIIEKPNYGKYKIEGIEGDVYYTPEVDGKEYSYIAETEDVAMLLGLQVKYQGTNSEFCKMACRMLNIDSLWAE